MFVNYYYKELSSKRTFEIDLSPEGLAKCVKGDSSIPHFIKEFDFSKSIKDLDFIRKKNSLYFPLLVKELNKHLNSDLDVRSWRILIGHWYENFSKAIFHRLSIIRTLAESKNLLSIDVLDGLDQELSSIDSNDLYNQCMSYEWNEKIFVEILRFSEFIPNEKVNELCKLNFLPYKGKIKRNYFYIKDKQFWKKCIRKIGICYNILISKVRGPVFYQMQFPVSQQLKLFLLTRRLPSFFPLVDSNRIVENTDLRRSLSFNMSKLYPNSNRSYEGVLLMMFFLCIPRNFLEGFHENQSQARSRIYPQRPEYIFLLNGFTLDKFSFFLAHQVSMGTPYLVGQHGGHYGLSKLEANSTVEEETADIFFTWGHSNSVSQNVVPAFNFTKKLKVRNYKDDNHIIIVTRPPFPSIEHYSAAGWYTTYVKGVVELIKAMDKSLFNKVILRIHPSGSPQFERLIWEMELPGIKIDDQKKFNINSLGKNGILIFTYMSTLFYQVLNSSNRIPICGIWKDIRNDTINLHQETMGIMHDAKIFFESTTEAAEHISFLFGKSSAWWLNSDQQNALQVFNQNLNRTSSSTKLAKDLLKKISKNLVFKTT